MASEKLAKIKAANRKKSSKAAEKSPFLARSFFLLPFSIVNWLTKGLPGWVKWPARAGLSLGVLGAIFGLFISVIYFALACTYDLKDVEIMPARTEILDRNGNILKNTQGREVGYLHGKNRLIVDYDEVSPFFVNALIAQEDARFRNHGAVDFRSFGRVAYRAVTRGKLEGGGTISMQLARSSYVLKKPGEDLIRGIHRKVLETFIAVRIESKFEKNEILQHYMNRIFWGGSIRGIEVASKTYLDKPAKELTLSDSALLAGIIRAPNRFNPFKDLESATLQRDWVVTKMLENGFITAHEAEKARATPLNIATANKNLLAGSYALDAIRRDLDRILEEENIRDGGLIIQTTLDPNIQEIAEKSVETRLAQVERTPGFPHQKRVAWDRKGAPSYIQGAAVVIDNNTGAVLAVVGGRNATESQFNRALQAARPVGSIFKPFMFLAAFDKGIKPYDTVSDAPIRPGEIPGVTGDWSPLNSDGKYYAEIPVSRALIDSRNTSSVRVASVAGFDRVFSVARSAGFDIDKIERVPSSFLGSWDATPEAVASAYTIFPNGGTRYRPYYIQSIKDRDGNILFENGPIPYRATEAGPAWEVSRILEEVNQRGTGHAVRSTYGFNRPSGGKTGTSNGPNDAWFAGYTSALTCAVWVGMDQGDVIIKNGSGSSLALPIWADIMKAADRLPGYVNGSIAPGRAVLVRPVEENIPRAVPVDDIPEALPGD
jgi:penicillin-binding protein 1A